MGYEVIFKYSEMENGVISEEVKELKKKIGSSTDEIDPRSLASLIFGQFARRDVFVRDAEIFEYVKKKIKFKQSSGGIQVGDHRFSYGDVADAPKALALAEISDEQPRAKKAVFTKSIDPKELGSGVAVAEFAYFRNRKPIREEIYSPPAPLAAVTSQKGIAMTKGKRYGIYEELLIGEISNGIMYVIKDDNGKKATLPDRLFESVPGVLSGGLQFNEPPPESNSTLMFEDEYEDKEMPNLRKMG